MASDMWTLCAVVLGLLRVQDAPAEGGGGWLSLDMVREAPVAVGVGALVVVGVLGLGLWFGVRALRRRHDEEQRPRFLFNDADGPRVPSSGPGFTAGPDHAGGSEVSEGAVTLEDPHSREEAFASSGTRGRGDDERGRMLRDDPPAVRTAPPAATPDASPDDATDDDRTLHLLPGRLEAVSGYPDREVRFVRGPGRARFTFGRSRGPEHEHIRILAPTVSRMHAYMEYVGGEWRVGNLSSTNGLVVDGELLEGDEESRGLSDGSRIEMGEVVFIFRER